MVELQDLLVSVIASVHVVQKNVDDLLKELPGLGLGVLVHKQNICEIRKKKSVIRLEQGYSSLSSIS